MLPNKRLPRCFRKSVAQNSYSTHKWYRREASCLRASSFYDEFLKQKPKDAALRFEVAVALRNLAEVDRLVDDHEQAEMRYVQSMGQLQALFSEYPGNPIYRRQLALVQDDLGQLLRSRNAIRAQEYHNEAIRLQLDLMTVDSSADLLQELANAHHNRGIILSQRKMHEEAESEYDRAIEILSRLVADYPDVALYHDRLGNSLFQVGSLQHQSQQDVNAVSNIERAMREHRLALIQSIAEPAYLQHLKNDLVGLALIHNKEGNHAEAFETAVKIKTEFANDGGNLFDSAQLIARCIDALEKDTSIESAEVREKTEGRYATQFIETLDAAYQAGFRDLTKIDKSR